MDQYTELGHQALHIFTSIPSAWIGLLIGATGLSLITVFINKILKVWQEVTSSRIFAGVFLLMGFIFTGIDFWVNNVSIDPGTLGPFAKAYVTLLGVATFIYHIVKIAKSCYAFLKLNLFTIKTKADEIAEVAKTVDQPLLTALELPADSVTKVEQKKNIADF